MNLFTPSILGAAVALAAALAPAARAAEPVAAPSTVPTKAFFGFADMSNPSISPDGSALAILVRNTAGRRQLAVMDTADMHKVKIVAAFDDNDIAWARWVDSKSLVFSLFDEQSPLADIRGTGLYSVGRDGDAMRTLINLNGQNIQTGTIIKGRALATRDYVFDRVLHDDSGDVVVDHLIANIKINAYGSHVTTVAPVRLNVRTGALTQMAKSFPDHVGDWLIDGQGQVKAGLQSIDGKTSVLVQEGDGSWKSKAEFPTYGGSADAFDFNEVGADGRVYVDKPAGPDGARGLFRYDLAAGRPDAQPLIDARGFDIDAVLVENWRDHKVLGLHYEGDAAGTVWFDAGMKAVQAKVDAKLPGLINQIDPADCGCAARVLVTSHSDHQPPVFFLYDRTDDTLIPFGNARPAINARQMADTDFVRIKARDGLEIPAYVTKPHGKGPWPTIVLVHGGPWVRGWHWAWDEESQFFASRGYLVVKPEFRGSRGYGAALERAGDKQWGLKIQDDIADAGQWAAAQGLADPKRMCIAGASFGGYATLMGLVRHPDQYRCGVAWAAVTDIDLMYDAYWSDASDDYRTYGMPTLIGDQVKDAELLKAASPLQQANRITRPLLLAHGGIDRRVPIVHATKLRSALEANHAPVTWIEYKDEGHGWHKPETRIGFYDDMLKFLDANIGPNAKP